MNNLSKKEYKKMLSQINTQQQDLAINYIRLDNHKELNSRMAIPLSASKAEVTLPLM